MRVAVISDIHANLHALEAALEAIAGEGVDEIWSLGDVVGYGPRPNECCAIVAARTQHGLVGNHDLGVLGALDLSEFSPDALASARWTQGVLNDESREYLAALRPSGARAGVGLYHASPRDPVWEYVLSNGLALGALEAAQEDVVLVGHSHVALALVLDGDLTGGVAPGGHEADLSRGRWLLNPGSVGQPRDGDPRAAYLLLDLTASTAEFRRVEYDVARTQAEIREAGLPDALAARLAHGV